MEERPRKRARLACVACNARRVKCNVTERRPCEHCAAANITCETRESRRGKHPRRRRPSQATDRQATPEQPLQEQHHHSHHQDDEVAASHVLASLSTLHAASHRQSDPAEDAPANHTHVPEDDAAVFLGESSSLRYLTHETPANPTPRRPTFRHSVPNAVKADALIPQWEAERRCSRTEALRADGAFSFPPISVRIELLEAYFRWYHPHFAVVDEPDVWASHADGSISPLLLQTLLFVGVIHCNDSTLKLLGWGSRHRAKYLFYTRAKDIYDAECENNKLTVIQSLFLLSCWRAGALLEKDVRHWLGVAINLAQTKALHRSANGTDERNAKLRRRLWWSIYIRERQCSAALGLPNRIRDEDCDVEPLAASDFQYAFNPLTPTSKVDTYAAYMMGMLHLARMLGQIVDAGYLPNRKLKDADRNRIRDALFEWKQHLPPSMLLMNDLSNDSSGLPSIQASFLHLAYNNLLILLHRSEFINKEDQVGATDCDIALQAAARSSRIIEDMLPGGSVCHAQIHVITNLFNALCIHVAHLRRSSGINRTIAEHRAKICLLGLQEIQKTWEVKNWLLQLFFQYLDRSTAARLAMEADEAGVTNSSSRDAGEVSINSAQPSVTTIDDTQDMHQENAKDGQNSADLESMMTPWSWTTDEANQYLFSQIENNFAFGEGGLLEWNQNDASNADDLPALGYDTLDRL
ncbi:hypothetical protein BS50DRAFT_545068 [Corynespora cassiicola Philippines]|uniref:Zn(2)-C6 fungal-type domain-containing protein n=1 Tax=Corynespora cassiicola Philippines TaxID=1448308 RepID=A0A2T2P462_CORCC|nr:hypothetical protein BS50DRAFT_545068 [Corynespora cassiicola Philippines]